MNRAQAKQLAEVMLAYANGKIVQVLSQGKWNDAKNPTFHPMFAWRIKPELADGWVNIYPDGATSCLFESKERADMCAISNKVRCIYVREVED